MNILIFNWRDIKNPESGGAEVLTHEMAKRWVLWGYTVVQFSSMFPSGVSEEVVDGVRIIRRGSADLRSLTIPVHLAAYHWYMRQGKGIFDVVIDEIHGIPFFTPFYVKEKKVTLICEVAQEIWDVAFSFPLNLLGRFIERNYFRWYRSVPFLTISESTSNDLIEMGVNPQMISVLPMGVSVPKTVNVFPKEKNPTLLFIARITKAKGIEDALEVIKHVRKNLPAIRLWVVGNGSDQYRESLMHQLKSDGIDRSITFFGFIDEKKKFELMRRAHVLIVPSIREGWGLTVPESAYVGTPAIGYNVAGLSDVIKDNQTGMLTAPNPLAMAHAVGKLLSDRVLYRKLVQGAERRVKTYSWDECAKTALAVLTHL